MNQRLTQAQLTQIVAEVERLSQRQQEELDQEQVKAILQELNLPPHLLDEAIVQIQRREVLAVRQRRLRWVLAGVGVAMVLIITSFLWISQQQQQMLTRLSVQHDRITLAADQGEGLTVVARQTNPELYYRVTLTEAPVGQTLSLSCQWLDPSGRIVHQNSYQTREIRTPIWNTFCRYTLGSSAPIGNWKVQMFSGDRLLSDTTFSVQ
ncbi:DUF3859 domain-containing protein [Pantanalinema sp. GBBB05]|uniref:DUF3859 domain-containing protein n=1 Tax=Pantanalinema sp. GBBB05 TaxID=2604139 RepID=UPI001DD7E60A|nr:DUF3859 domain-containing protein [Pantanalinema sp. GBBB05]